MQERSINLASSDIEQTLKRQVNLQQPSSNARFLQGARYLRPMTTAISSRGGKVLFVAMPTSGMIREIEEKRHPSSIFLNLFEKETGIPVLHFENDPVLQSIICPDGSHLDFRDRARFTTALTHSLPIHQ